MNHSQAATTLTNTAREDLIEIWLRVAADDLTAADRVLDRLERAAINLSENPRMGPARDDIRPGLRYLVSDLQGMGAALNLQYPTEKEAKQEHVPQS